MNHNGDAKKILLEFDFLASWDDPDAEVERFCSGGLSSLSSNEKNRSYQTIMVKTKQMSKALDTNVISNQILNKLFGNFN